MATAPVPLVPSISLPATSSSSPTVPSLPHPISPRSAPFPPSAAVLSSDLTLPPLSQPCPAPVFSSGTPTAPSAHSPPPCPTSDLPSLSCPNLVPVAGAPPVIPQAPPPSYRAPPLSSAPDASSSPTINPPISDPLLSSPPANPLKPSYAQAARSVKGTGFVRAHAVAVEHFAWVPRTGANIICGSKEGIPSFSFDSSDLPKVEEIYSNALVMKFSGGRPSLEASHKEILSWGMVKPFSIGPLSSRAFLLRFQDSKDLLKVLTRPWSLLISFPYIVFRWHKLCHLPEDSSLAPVWISLPRLPLQCFIPEFLESVGNKLGRFLCFDRATTTLARPSAARFCVELDLRKTHP